MDRQQFTTAAALALFAAFLAGWFAAWLVGRLARSAHADPGAIDRLAHDLHEAEAARDAATAALAAREAGLNRQLAATGDELRLALHALTESRTEIEELRDYIEQRLAAGRGARP